MRENNTSTRRQPHHDHDDDDPQQSNEEKCAKFVNDTCGCKLAVGDRPCSTLFTAEYYRDIRAQAALLSHEQLDMVILGSIMSTISTDEDIVHGRHKLRSDLGTERSTCTMDIKFVRLPLLSFLESDQSTSCKLSRSIMLKMG